MVLCALLALLTSGWADDYKTLPAYGYLLHAWSGLAAGVFCGLRILYGLVGPASIRFATWLPLTVARLLPVWQDCLGLLRMRLPERPPHVGLAGMVEAVGLLAMTVLAGTGGWLYLGLIPGQKAHGVMHAVKDVHEAAGSLLFAFLAMHAGAVLLHALAGHHLWRQMFFLSKTESYNK